MTRQSANVTAFVGGNGPANSGFLYLALKPLEQRKISASQLINRLRPKLGAVPGATVFVQAGQDLRIGGRQSSSQFQYTIQSDNLDDLVQWGPTLLKEMRKLPGFTDVNSDQQNNGLQASLVYDRSTAAASRISPQLIDNTLYDAFWTTAGLDHVQLVESVSCRHGSRPQILAKPRRLEPNLPARD